MPHDRKDRLPAIKARREILAGWHEAYLGSFNGQPSQMQRCRRCGAESLDYPETEIEHDEGCPIPGAMRDGHGDLAWLIAEVEWLRTINAVDW